MYVIFTTPDKKLFTSSLESAPRKGELVTHTEITSDGEQEANTREVLGVVWHISDKKTGDVIRVSLSETRKPVVH